MKAFEISEFGATDVLHLVDRPKPQFSAGEALIRVQASGINRPDVLQRKGNYPVPPGVSDLPGLEIAGIIEDADPQALAQMGLKLGDAVCALVAGGGYAQWCVAPLAQCLPIPKGLSAVEAASLPETFFTVWSNVFDRGLLKAGEILLVQGGTSGIGVAAIQMAKAFGATVIATAGSDEKCSACLSLGADHAVNYKKEDFAQAVKLFAPKGVNVILDMVAGSYVAKEIELLAEDGRLVIIAVQGGIEAQVNAGLILRKRLTLTGSTLRPRPIAFKGAIAKNLLSHVWPKLEAGLIKPVIHQVFDAMEPTSAAKAHALMESNQHVGKILLDWEYKTS
jgi:NADPH2:quinone reductase